MKGEDHQDQEDEELKSQNESLVHTLKSRLHAQYQGSIIPDSLIDISKANRFYQKFQRSKNASQMTSNLSESIPHFISPSSNISRVDESVKLPPLKGAEKSTTMPLTARATSVITSAKMELREKEGKAFELRMLKLRSKKIVPLAHGDFINLPDFKKSNKDPLKAEEFIARIKANSSLENEFIYCVKGNDFYDFINVSFHDKFAPKKTEKPPSEYLTISRRGVTHFLNGDSTFMSLSEWMNELEKYRKIKTELKFFSQYVMWKNYYLWKRLMKSTKVMERRDELIKTLFMANAVLHNEMVNDVRKYAIEVSSIDLFKNGQWETVDIKDYKIGVREYLKTTRERVVEKNAKIISFIAECCAKSTKEFQENNRIDFKDDDKKGMAPFMVGDETHQDMPYTQEAARRTHFRRLAKFIRMQDMIMMDARRMMMLNSFQKLADHLGYGLGNRIEIGKKRKSFLKITLTYNEKEGFIDFEPTQGTLIKIIKKLIGNIIDSISSIEKYAADPSFEGFFTALKDEEEPNTEEVKSLGDIVTEDKVYENAARAIESNIKCIYQQIADNYKSYSDIMTELRKNTARNFDELKTNEYGVFQEWLSDFKKLENQIELIEDSTPKGFSVVNCEVIKAEMRKLSQDCLQKMKKLIPEYISEEMTNLKVKLRVIQERCTKMLEGLDLDDYVTEFKYFKEHKEKEQLYCDIIEKCKKIDQYSKDFNLSAQDKTKLINDTEKQFNTMRASLNHCHELCLNQTISYIRKIESKYPVMRNALTDITSELKSERFLNDKFDRMQIERDKGKKQAVPKEKAKEPSKEPEPPTQPKGKEEEKKDAAPKEEQPKEALKEAPKEETKQLEIEQTPEEREKRLSIDNIKLLLEFEKKINSMAKSHTMLSAHEKFLEKEPVEVEEFKEAKDLHNTNRLLWTGIHMFSEVSAEWNKTKILEANYHSMNEFLKEYTELVKITESSENMANKNLELRIIAYKTIIPIIHCMQSPALGLIDRKVEAKPEKGEKEKLDSEKAEREERADKAEKFFTKIKEILFPKLKQEGPKKKEEYRELTIQYLISNKTITKETCKKIKEIRKIANKEKEMEDAYDLVRKKWETPRIVQEVLNKLEYYPYLPLIRKENEELNEMMTGLIALTNKRHTHSISTKVNALYQNIAELLSYIEDIEYIVSINIKYGKIKTQESSSGEKKSDEKEAGSRDTGYVRKIINTYLTGAAMKSYPKQLSICKIDGNKHIREKIQTANEFAQNLEQFFDYHKKNFHRLYLLSPDDLITMFSFPEGLQGLSLYFKDLFTNVKEIQTQKSEDGNTIIYEKAISHEGEPCLLAAKGAGKKIEIAKNADASKIGTQITDAFKESIKSNCKLIKDKIYEASDNLDRCEIVKQSNLSQCISFVDFQIFTSGVELLMQEDESYDQNFDDWKMEFATSIGAMLKLINAAKTPSYQRKTLSNLVIQLLHFSEIIEYLRTQQVHDPNDFRWLQFPRLYVKSKDDIIICIGSTAIEYGFEYIGPSTRIQITPIIERCFLSIGQAFKSKQGIVMAGISGEGKIETLRELSKMCAKFFIEFTCSYSTPIQALRNIMFAPVYIGKSSTWLCLKHIDLLPLVTLSVLKQELLNIQTCQRSGEELIRIGDKIEEESKDIIPHSSNKIYGLFATLQKTYPSPAVKMPSELKEFFRPFYIASPEFSELLKMPLYSHGVADFDSIGDKLSQLFKMAPMLMSPQHNYDFTFRRLQTFIKELDNLLSSSKQDIFSILETALSTIIIPTLLKDDAAIFISTFNTLFNLHNTFKGIYDPSPFPKFEEFCKSESYVVDEKHIPKAYQLYNSLMIMKGAFIVGRAMAGKTTLINDIIRFRNYIMKQEREEKEREEEKNKTTEEVKEKESKDNCNIHAVTIYPSALSPGLLLGKNPSSVMIEKEVMTEICDIKPEKGIIKTFLSKCCENTDYITWFILDGDTSFEDSDTISTLIASTPKIFFGNGVYMSPKSEVKVLFENHSLENYSPSVLSRSAIIYMGPEQMSWKKYTDEWLNSMEDRNKGSNDYFGSKIRDILQTLISKVVPIGIEKRDNILKYSSFEPVIYLCKLIESMYSPTLYVAEDKPLDNRIKILEKIFCYCFMWAFSSGMNLNDAKRFEKDTQGSFNAGNLPKGPGGILSIFDHYPDIKHDTYGDYKYCGNKKSFHYSSESAHTIFVHNKETYVIHKLIKFCMYGELDMWIEGKEMIGKSTSIVKSLEKLKTKCNQLQIPINFMHFIITQGVTPESLQSVIEYKMDKKKKTLLDGMGGKKAVIFIDDLHIGSKYVDDMARMLCNIKGVFNRDPVYWKQLGNTSLILCSNTNFKGYGKRNRTFKIRAEPLSEVPAEEIFKTISEGIYTTGKYSEEFKDTFKKIGDAITSMYNNIRHDIKITPKDILKRFGIKEAMKVAGEILFRESKEQFASKDILEFTWANETLRAYGDRLSNPDEFKIITDFIGQRICEPQRSNLLFTDLLGDYKLIDSVIELKEMIGNKISEYLKTEALDIFLFNDLMVNISKVHRALLGTRSTTLLIGPGSVSRRLIVKIVAFLKEIRFHELERGQFIHTLLAINKSKMPSVVFVKLPIKLTKHDADLFTIINHGSEPSIVLNEEDISLISKLTMDKNDFAELEKINGEPQEKGDKVMLDFEQKCMIFFKQAARLSRFAFSGNDTELEFVHSIQNTMSIVRNATIIAIKGLPTQVIRDFSKSYLEKQSLNAPDKILEAFSTSLGILTKMDSRFSSFKLFYDCIKFFKAIFVEKMNNVDTKIAKYTESINTCTECESLYQQYKEKLETMRMPTTKPVDNSDLTDEQKDQAKEQFIKTKKETEEKKVALDKLNRLFGKEDTQRWKDAIEVLTQTKSRIYGDTFIIAIMYNYYGPLTFNERMLLTDSLHKLLEKQGIPFTANLQPYNYLINKTSAQRFIGEVFPNDEYSSLNALIMLHGPRRPLICDKYRVFTKKLIETLNREMSLRSKDSNSYTGKAELKIMHQEDSMFYKELRKCIMNGGVMVIDEVTTWLDNRLTPLLNNQVYEKEKRGKVIRIDNEEIEFNKNFMLVMITSLDQKDLPSNIITLTSVVGFDYDINIVTEIMLSSICKKGLDDPNAKIEEIDQKIVDSIYKHKLKIVDQENARVMDTVEATRTELYKAISNSSNIIDANNCREARREQYKSVALLSNYVLKMLIALERAFPLYGNTMAPYMLMLIKTINEIDNSPQNDPPPDNTRDCVYNTISKQFFQYFYSRILSKHKLLFKFLSNTFNMISLRLIREAEFIIIVKGIPGMQAPKSLDECLAAIGELSKMLGEPYTTIHANIKASSKQFNDWINMPNLDNLQPPVEAVKGIDKKKYSIEYANLVLIRVCKPFSLYWGVQKFIDTVFYPCRVDQEEVEGPIDNKLEIKSLDSRTPLIVICGKGVDPIGELLSLLPATKEKENVDIVRKILHARNYTKEFIKESFQPLIGSSVQIIIKNVHQISDYYECVSNIYNLIATANKDDLGIDFRLIFITEQLDQFPWSLACHSKKLIFEEHQSRKNKMKSSLTNILNPPFKDFATKDSKEFYKEPKEMKLLFSICLMHSIINHRGKYNFLMWSPQFKYSLHDFTSSYYFMRDFYNKGTNNLEDIITQYMSISYGGIMKSENDKQVLQCIIKNFINERVFGDKYIFSDSQKYYIPETASENEYAAKIQAFPPLEFGDLLNEGKKELLHYENYKSNKLYSCLSGCVEKEKQKEADIKEIVAKLLEVFPTKVGDADLNEITRMEFASIKFSISPLSSCLYQEVQKANNIVLAVRKSLEFVRSCLEMLRLDYIPPELLNSLLQGNVPNQWAQYFPKSPTLASWVAGITERITYIKQWGKEPKSHYWLGGMFYPQSLFTAIKMSCINKKLPTELDTEVTPYYNPTDIPEPLENAFYLYGLFVINAKISEGNYALDDNRLKEDINPMPVICVMPVPSIEPVEGQYDCPVLLSMHRELVSAEKNYVASIKLNTEVVADYWIQKGVAIICNKN